MRKYTIKMTDEERRMTIEALRQHVEKTRRRLRSKDTPNYEKPALGREAATLQGIIDELLGAI
jgi:hypothetical protein